MQGPRWVTEGPTCLLKTEFSTVTLFFLPSDASELASLGLMGTSQLQVQVGLKFSSFLLQYPCTCWAGLHQAGWGLLLHSKVPRVSRISRDVPEKVDSCYHLPYFSLSLTVEVSMVLMNATGLEGCLELVFPPSPFQLSLSFSILSTVSSRVGLTMETSSGISFSLYGHLLCILSSNVPHQRLPDSLSHLPPPPAMDISLLKLVAGNLCQTQSRCSLGKGNTLVKSSEQPVN